VLQSRLVNQSGTQQYPSVLKHGYRD